MARLVRGHPTARSQQEGTEESGRDPQQGEQPDATEGKDIADYDPDVDYKGSEPKVEPDMQEQSEVDPDTEHAKIEKPRSGTLHLWMMPWEMHMGILQVHKT